MHLRKGNFSEEPQTSGALSHFKWWEQPTSPHLRKIWTGTSPAALELELCTQNPQQSQQSEWTVAEYDLGKVWQFNPLPTSIPFCNFLLKLFANLYLYVIKS